MKSLSKSNVLVVGRATLDILIKSNGFPNLAEQDEIREQLLLPGGSALNVAVTFADFGVNTALCCKTGDDPPADFIQRFLKERGVSVAFQKYDEYLPTSLSIINIGGSGEISILHNVGANKNLNLDDLPVSQLSGFEVVHIGGAMLMEHLDGEPTAVFLKEARAAGAVTSLNTTRNTKMRSVLNPVYEVLDYIFMNEKESLEISECIDKESACQWFHLRGVQTVAITCGASGAYVSGPGFNGFVPGIKVNAVDSTGCGDAFAAGFLSAKLKGADLINCARWGNAVGAHCARTTGAVPVPFDTDEICAMIRSDGEQGEVAALVLAGGISSRMKGVPQKLVVPLAGKPLIQWTIECIRKAGVHRIVAILGHQAPQVKRALYRQPMEFFNIGEVNTSTGKALQKTVLHLTDLPAIVYVVNGDTPLLEPEALVRLREELVRSDSAVTVAVSETPNFIKYGHGAIIMGEKGEFQRVEHYTAAAKRGSSGFINTGTYCFRRDALIEGCSHLFAAADGKIHFSDILTVLKTKCLPVKLVHFDSFDQFISINTFEHLEEMEEKFRGAPGNRR